MCDLQFLTNKIEHADVMWQEQDLPAVGVLAADEVLIPPSYDSLDVDDPKSAHIDAIERERKEAQRLYAPAVDETELRGLKDALGRTAPFVRFLLTNSDGVDRTDKELAELLGKTTKTIRNWRKQLKDNPDVRTLIDRSTQFPPE